MDLTILDADGAPLPSAASVTVPGATMGVAGTLMEILLKEAPPAGSIVALSVAQGDRVVTVGVDVVVGLGTFGAAA